MSDRESNRRVGTRIRGADGNLYLVQGASVATDAVPEEDAPASEVAPRVTAREEAMLPVAMCLIVTDDGAELPPERASDANMMPVAMCLIVTDDGAELPPERATGRKAA